MNNAKNAVVITAIAISLLGCPRKESRQSIPSTTIAPATSIPSTPPPIEPTVVPPPAPQALPPAPVYSATNPPPRPTDQADLEQVAAYYRGFAYINPKYANITAADVKAYRADTHRLSFTEWYLGVEIREVDVTRAAGNLPAETYCAVLNNCAGTSEQKQCIDVAEGQKDIHFEVKEPVGGFRSGYTMGSKTGSHWSQICTAIRVK